MRKIALSPVQAEAMRVFVAEADARAEGYRTGMEDAKRMYLNALIAAPVPQEADSTNKENGHAEG